MEVMTTELEVTGGRTPMQADEARRCIESIKMHMSRAESSIQRARVMLFDLYERRGWEVLGYANWRVCAASEFPHSTRYLYLQLNAAQAEQNIFDHDQIGTIPEAHLRPLTGLRDDPVAQREAWQRAVETAPDGKVTGTHVASIVEEIKAGGMAVHYSSETHEWYTPQSVIDIVVGFFDQIDLDPCSNSHTHSNVPARQVYTVEDDGLSRPWWGRVYMNPPYGDVVGAWVEKLCTSYESGDIEAAIALVPGRLDTAWFDRLTAYALCFVRGRLRFSGAENTAPFPSVLVYLGDEVDRFTDCTRKLGKVFVQVGIVPGDRTLDEADDEHRYWNERNARTLTQA